MPIISNKVYLQLHHEIKNGVASGGTLIFSSIVTNGGW